MMTPAFEVDLMSEEGVKDVQSKCVSSPCNNRLDTEWDCCVSAQESEGIKVIAREGPVSTDDTAVTESDDDLSESPTTYQVNSGPVKTARRKPTVVESFSGVNHNASLDEFYGTNVDSARRPNVKSLASLRSLGSHGSSKKKSENPKKAKVTVPKGKHTRKVHLDSHVARVTPPLEAVLLSRFDLNYEDAICIVADARTSLGVSKWEPWTDALYKECKIIYELNYAPNNKSDEKYMETERRIYALDSEKVTQGSDNDDESCCSGWESGSGWSSMWEDNDGDFSVSTHDPDDVYSVSVIRKFKKTFEQYGANVVPIRDISVSNAPTESKVDETYCRKIRDEKSSRYSRTHDLDGVDHKSKAIRIEKEASNGVNFLSDAVNAAYTKKTTPGLAARLLKFVKRVFQRRHHV